MQSTTNYSMNLVEGTDLVNIPVQLNPNFQTIDQEMFANKQSSIGVATEVVTGTVHAIVRSNTDSDIFRFTATGAWTAGDTMTLDGTAVTVHLADGTAPATGAYVIGAEVVAVVNGTLVTLLTSAAQPVAGVTSFNSRTGAVVPQASDYDAADIDYDNTISGLTATDLQSAIDELAGSSAGSVIMWSNLDPSQAVSSGIFATFTDDSVNPVYIIVYGASSAYPNSTGSSTCPVGKSSNIVKTQISATGKVEMIYRNVTISRVGDTVTCSSAGGHIAVINTYGSAPSDTVNDAQLIPLMIIRI